MPEGRRRSERVILEIEIMEGVEMMARFLLLIRGLVVDERCGDHWRTEGEEPGVLEFRRLAYSRDEVTDS